VADEPEIRLEYLSEVESPRILAYVGVPGIGSVRFNKFGDDPWFAEALMTADGEQLWFYDTDWASDEYAPIVLPEGHLNALLEAALDKQPELRQRAIDELHDDDPESEIYLGMICRFGFDKGGEDAH
jgi:hypothetical protein